MMYSHTFLTKEELEHILQYKIDPLELNRIISAYDMADWAYGDKKSLDGSLYFFHVTRVCKILINELEIYDPEMLISALLHDVYQKIQDITPEIIIYNFGPYIAYLMEILQHDLKYIKVKPFTFGENEVVRIPVDDYLILWLSEHLDNFRCLEITPNFSPVNYILNITQTLIAQSKNNDNVAIKYLITELKKERNKILG